jgi:steroid delta-isomerase-like uncharacterized protein
MSTGEENKALLRRYVEAVWDQQNLEAIDDFLAPDYRRHPSPTAEPLTRAGQRQLLTQFRTAFPDARLTIDEIIAEGDRVAFRSTMRATHQGEFFGIPPTGKQVAVGLVDVIHIRNGKFVEQWGGPNLLDLVQQLGAEISAK